MTWYLIIAGEVTRQVQSLDGEDVEEKEVIEVSRCGDLRIERFDASAGDWVDRIDVLRADAIAGIDAAREAQQREILTPGTAKALMYAQKAREAALYQSLGGVAVDGLSAADRAAQFPAAAAEADVTGDLVSAVLARITAAAARSDLYRVEAQATSAKAALRDASTKAEIAAILSGVWQA